MLRFLFRFLGLLLLAAAFVGLVVDGARSIANGVVAFTPFGEVAQRLLGDRYLAFQPFVERHGPAFLWDPVLRSVTLAPAALCALTLGVLLLWIGRRRAEPIGFQYGR